MPETLSLIFFAVNAGLFILGVLYDTQEEYEQKLLEMGTPYIKQFGGRYKFLTYLDMNLQAIYYTICTVNSLHKILFNPSKKHPLNRFCNLLFVSLAFPFGVFVSFAFWGLYFVEPELVWSKLLESVVPNWHNQIMHTLPIVGVLLDSYLHKHTYNKSFLKGSIIPAFFGVSYIAWTFVIHHYGGYWVYPVFDKLSNNQRTAFISALCVIMAIFYKLGDFLNSLFWSKNGHKTGGKNKSN